MEQHPETHPSDHEARGGRGDGPWRRRRQLRDRVGRDRIRLVVELRIDDPGDHAAVDHDAAARPHPTPSKPWGGQRSDETLLTGDTASKVEAAAVAKVGSGATVVRVETDADGHAAYEVHMVKADGTPTTVYVDEQFDVVSVETR